MKDACIFLNSSFVLTLCPGLGLSDHMVVLFLFFEEIHTVFNTGYTNLHSHQQYIRVPFLYTLPSFVIFRLYINWIYRQSTKLGWCGKLFQRKAIQHWNIVQPPYLDFPLNSSFILVSADHVKCTQTKRNLLTPTKKVSFHSSLLLGRRHVLFLF